MGYTLIKQKKKIRGFSLVELLIAIGIFAIVVSANFALAMNAYRGRANDRIRLEAGLVIKDAVNGVYTYKTTNWSALIGAMQENGSQKLDLIDGKFQLNSGTWTSGNVTFEMYIEKASRENGELKPDGSGGDPDTIKLTLIASWRDFFGIEQEITESYFLSNWASERWSETTYSEFTDGDVVPVMSRTQVKNDSGDGSVILGNEIVYANNDWCNIEIQNVDTSGDSIVDIIASKRSQTNLGYEIYEPETDFVFDDYPLPLPPAESTIQINNITPICDWFEGSLSDAEKDCEVLAKFYKSLGGDDWTINDGWDSINDNEASGASPFCDWHGITCVGGRVTEIELSDNNLDGFIPREIGVLSELKILSLTNSTMNSNLTGSIPPEIGLLQNLEELTITNLSIGGRIPETVGILSNLEIIEIDNTEVTGSIPNSIGHLSSLINLTITNSKLTCHVPPEITLLESNLQEDADFSNNHLLPSRYSEITDFVILDNQNSPLALDEDALLDCAKNPAESNIVAVKSDSSERTLQNINLPNSDFPVDPSIGEIPTFNKSGWTSNGLEFANDVVTIPFDSAYNRMSEGNAYTISVWIKPDQSNGTDYSRFVDFSDGSSGWFLSFGAGGNQNRAHFFHYGSNSISLTSTSNLSTGQWTHIAVVMDGGEDESTARMFINGTQVSTDSYEDIAPFANPSGYMRFGNNSAGNLGPSITMDEVRMYNRALSGSEIYQTKDFEVSRDDPGLVGYWRMNNEVNILFNTVYDFSPKNNHGTSNLATTASGKVEYRINSIYHYKDRIFFGTSHPTQNMLIYNSDIEQWDTVNLGLASTHTDTQAIVVEEIDNEDLGFILHDSYLIRFNPEDDEPGIETQININQGGTGISNPISMGISDGRIYITGLDSRKNLQVVEIEEDGDLVVESVRNILLDTYL